MGDHDPARNPLTDLVEMIRAAVRAELTASELAPPAPYPVAVKIEEAARLIQVHPATIRSMVAEGRLRTIDMGDRRIPRIPVVALFELDPEYRRSLDLRLLDSGVDPDGQVDAA